MLGSAIGARSATVIQPEAKTADPVYLTPEHKRWREQVIARAGGRCQWIENGARCSKAQPMHRMFADHIEEIKDDGARYDVRNGQCLCGAHHTRKTAAARAQRLAR